MTYRIIVGTQQNSISECTECTIVNFYISQMKKKTYTYVSKYLNIFYQSPAENEITISSCSQIDLAFILKP